MRPNNYQTRVGAFRETPSAGLPLVSGNARRVVREQPLRQMWIAFGVLLFTLVLAACSGANWQTVNSNATGVTLAVPGSWTYSEDAATQTLRLQSVPNADDGAARVTVRVVEKSAELQSLLDFYVPLVYDDGATASAAIPIAFPESPNQRALRTSVNGTRNGQNGNYRVLAIEQGGNVVIVDMEAVGMASFDAVFTRIQNGITVNAP